MTVDEPGCSDLATASQAMLQGKEFPSIADRDFFGRVFATPPAVYTDRVRAVGFEGLDRVLDAACGYGQWSLAMAGINTRVVSFDLTSFRIGLVRSLAAAVATDNIETLQSSLDRLPFADRSFDGVFCYGAVFFVDFRLAFREFHRVLKPGGRLYFTANGPGWYLYNLAENHKPSADFSPRREAFRNLCNTARFFSGLSTPPGLQVAIPVGSATRALQRAGFERIEVDGDGRLRHGNQAPPRPFFPKTKYGLVNVYEVLCRKPAAIGPREV